MNTATRKKQPTRAMSQQWYLVTNHQNLLYMLAAGLVLHPAQFGGKYYRDPLDVIPGWVPLFRNVVPAQALKDAVSEGKHLRACIVAFDLSSASGPVLWASQKGQILDREFPPKAYQNPVLFIRSPVPLSSVSEIYFETSDDREAFEMAASNVSNVMVGQACVKVEPSLFKARATAEWPPERLSVWQQKIADAERQEKLPLNPVDSASTSQSGGANGSALSREQALGGVLAMLYHSSNRSDLACRVWQDVTAERKATTASGINDLPMLPQLRRWMTGERQRSGKMDLVSIYWGVVNTLAAIQPRRNSETVIENVLVYLQSCLDGLSDPIERERLRNVMKDMQNCFGLGGATMTTLFESNPCSVTRALIMLCLRDTCEELLEFVHPMINDADYLWMAVLFGARDGWLALPCQLRPAVLVPYVTYQMAAFGQRTHKIALEKDVFSFGPSPQCPIPLRILFDGAEQDWADVSMVQAAIFVAQSSGWWDCLETVVKSDDGTPLNLAEQQQNQFIFGGNVQVEKRVRKAEFTAHLRQWPPMDASVETQVRQFLMKKAGESACE